MKALVRRIIRHFHPVKKIPIRGNLNMRKGILKFEKKLAEVPGALIGHDTEALMPLKHTFCPGAYVREIFAPKGTIVVTKIHKVEHPYFILKGEVSVLTETGSVRLKAPYYGITPAGTKRIVYIHEDCLWVTVHVTEKTDLAKIEDEIIAKSYDEFLTESDVLKLKEA